MARKLAIFVEGQTEVQFTERLLQELSGHVNIRILSNSLSGRISRTFLAAADNEQDYFVLIFDCSGDGGVKSRIRDNYTSLAAGGYDFILGLRDLFPNKRTDLEKVQASLSLGIPTGSVPLQIVIAVMEIEAWFLMETSLLTTIDVKLDCEYVKSSLGLDLTAIAAEEIEEPAKTLNAIYELAGKTYSKKGWQVRDIVYSLDYDHIYIELQEKIAALKQYIVAIEQFLCLTLIAEEAGFAMHQ